jgi:endonuclease YncB( thermonuclease family)
MKDKRKFIILLLLSTAVVCICSCPVIFLSDTPSQDNTQENALNSPGTTQWTISITEIAQHEDEQTKTVQALLSQAALAQTQASEALLSPPDDPLITMLTTIAMQKTELLLTPEAIRTTGASKTQASQPTQPPIVPAVASHDCVPDSTQRDLAQLVRVIDGDTIDVVVNGQIQRVRYIGMDTPENGDNYFAESASANENLISGQTLTLVKDVSETDLYGRLLRYVFVGDDVFVNYELVRQGYAQISTYPPDVACLSYFLEAQSYARELGLGFWGLPLIVPTSPPPTEGPQPQPGRVIIDYINYDGIVHQVESDEYVVIKNTGSTAVDITSWRINADDPGQDFYFPSFSLQSGQSCRVYTNEIHPETCGFSFGSGQAIWANSGECGHSFNSSGAEVDTYCYN